MTRLPTTPAVRARIAAACAPPAASRECTLLAVSKTFGPEAVREAHAAGQRAFGENYIQEGVEKIAALADLPAARVALHRPDPEQQDAAGGRALRLGATVDRLKIAQRLSEQRPANCRPAGVHPGQHRRRRSKSGVCADEALALAREVAACRGCGCAA